MRNVQHWGFPLGTVQCIVFVYLWMQEISFIAENIVIDLKM